MMDIVKEYLAELLKSDTREEDRNASEYRKIDIELNPIFQASGSARVRIGKTDVIASVMLSTGVPFPDSADQGVLMVNAELSPLASRNFELGPPRENSIELSRVVDRMIRESKVVNMDKLCIKVGEKVWMVLIDLYPVNADGNLFDAAALAAMAALKNAKMPKYDTKEERVVPGEFTKDKLPLQAMPMLCTFGKLDGLIFLDPTAREEEATDARLCIATTDDGHIHDMQKGGEGTFSTSEILKITDIAVEEGKKLRKLI